MSFFVFKVFEDTLDSDSEVSDESSEVNCFDDYPYSESQSDIEESFTIVKMISKCEICGKSYKDI
jgi:hypothetical protein